MKKKLLLTIIETETEKLMSSTLKIKKKKKIHGTARSVQKMTVAF